LNTNVKHLIPFPKEVQSNLLKESAKLVGNQWCLCLEAGKNLGSYVRIQLALKKGVGKLKCKICDEELKNRSFCRLHAKAHQNILERFKDWEKALDISWKEYLGEILRNSSSGIKVKEVAETLLSEIP
jgi:hypothetical protein